jgi:hypothetical protein
MSAFRSGPLTMKLNPVKPRPGRSHSRLTACLAGPVTAWLRLGRWIDADAHVEDAADLAWPSADRSGSGVDPAPHGGNLPSGHGARRGDPAVSEPGGDSERARPEGPRPYRDRAAGPGFHVQVADAVVAPVLGVAGVCPGAADDLNGVCEVPATPESRIPRPCVAAPPAPRLVKIPPTRLPATYQARAAAPQRMPFSTHPAG